MTRRYFVPDLPVGGGQVSLSDEEASHAARVMRAKVGDRVELFDGKGTQADATIDAIDRRSCSLQVSNTREVNRELKTRIELLIAFPKPERAKEMIERLTEIGVQRIVPVVCEHTQRPPSDSLLTKLRRIVIESSKQCGRNHLMQIDSAQTFESATDEVQLGSAASIRLIAHQSGEEFSTIPKDGFDNATVLIGPEGGFTVDEIKFATARGFSPVGLGTRIYRTETAATVMAALLSQK